MTSSVARSGVRSITCGRKRSHLKPAQLDPSVSSGEVFFNSIQKLSPQNDVQRSLKSQASQIANDIGQMRWLLFEQTETSISVTMLIILISWLAIIFMSAGLFAPAECHGRYCANAGRTVSIRSDLPDPRTGHRHSTG